MMWSNRPTDTFRRKQWRLQHDTERAIYNRRTGGFNEGAIVFIGALVALALFSQIFGSSQGHGL